MRQFRKRMLSNGLAMALVISSLTTIPVSATNNKFKDIEGHWAENQIKNFIQKGYIQGYSDGTFRPNRNTTRAEFISIINRAFGFIEKGTEEFNDVNPGDWFYDEVLKAVKKGYIQGYGDGTFRPNDSISREEACKIVGIILKANGYGNTKFKDDNEISEWSKQYIKGLVDMGIIKGFEDNTFRPKNKATRAESVTVIKEASEYKPTQTEVKVSTQQGLKDAINSGKNNIVIIGDFELNENITINSNQTLQVDSNLIVSGELTVNGELTVKEDAELTVNGELIVDGTIDLNGSIKVGGNSRSGKKIIMDSMARMNIYNGAHLELNNFDEIITKSSSNLLLHANSTIKIGDKVYIGRKDDSNASINLENYENSNRHVAQFFITDSGDLLLTVFEKAKVMKMEEETVDLSILVKAGDDNTEPGELTIPNLNVLSEIEIEANATLICNDEVLVSKDNSNSVFNVSGGDIDNNKGITFRNENTHNISTSAYIRGDVTMNKGLSNVNIIPESRNGQTYKNSIYIVFNPNNDVSLMGIDTVEKVKYESSDGIWIKTDTEVLSSGFYYEKSSNTYSITSAKGLKALNDKMTSEKISDRIRDKKSPAIINIESDIDFSDYTWKEADIHVDSGNIIKEINGNGHTIRNMNIEGRAMFKRIALQNHLTIKDITFDKVNVSADAINVSLISVQNYSDTLLENIDVSNSSFQGRYKVSTLVGTVYNENKTTTTTTVIKDCDITDCTVTATQFDFCTTGLVAFVYTADNDKIELSNNTINKVELFAPISQYNSHAWIYTEGSETLHDEAEGVTVTNCTFENK